ncbi:MerR family transcriptional regulator [Dehalococcoidia bacterium]|nr:MerR family transcriptional regulator [Dehalococcoidia bacterium]MCL0059696.1 MerR family transcriptional regulator [Dehalococcoidia bacterium]MCL0093213.1 MerR family transcriptional regulator [Dehalococcoidia bacterium]MCL0099177.1 MerR family transcriptional regulator [Dehalococcoidia bacterium]
MNWKDTEPRYVINVAARKVGVHTHTLRYYERLGIIQPKRSPGNQRLYSTRDIKKLQQIRTLADNLGINLAGVEVILRLTQRMTEMEKQIQAMESEIKRLSK